MKLPNGVAGIRGTVYDITVEGLIKVLTGSVVLAYVGPDGSVLTQVIMGLQMFDARTGTLSPLPDTDKTGLGGIVNQLLAGLAPVPPSGGLKPPDGPIPPPLPISVNQTPQYISPH